MSSGVVNAEQSNTNCLIIPLESFRSGLRIPLCPDLLHLFDSFEIFLYNSTLSVGVFSFVLFTCVAMSKWSQYRGCFLTSLQFQDKKIALIRLHCSTAIILRHLRRMPLPLSFVPNQVSLWMSGKASSW